MTASYPKQTIPDRLCFTNIALESKTMSLLAVTAHQCNRSSWRLLFLAFDEHFGIALNGTLNDPSLPRTL